MRNIDLDNERDFENRKVLGEGVRDAQSKFYWATWLPNQVHNELAKEAIRDARVLEIGCSSGSDALEYCKFAADYIGVDISDVAIQHCRTFSLPNASFYCVDGHVLPVEDKSVDYVIVNSLLHHLDLDVAFKEISRVLTDEGSLIFREPLGTNPIFQLYRMATPGARTVDERPFTFYDLRLMRKYFILDKSVQWFGFFSILSGFGRSRSIRYFLTSVDRLIGLTPMKYLFWQFSGVVRKNPRCTRF